MKYELIQPEKLIVSKSSLKGRGVFAKSDIDADEVVEECHFVIPEKHKGGEDKEMMRYMFACICPETKEEHIDLSSKLFLHQAIDDEGVKEDIEKCLREMGYENLGDLFSSAFVLGLGMVYNHSDSPNIRYEFDYDEMLFRYTANQDICAGEELLIDYGNTESRKDLK